MNAFLKSLALFLFIVISNAETVKAQFAGGSGTEEDPYQVATATQLDSVRNYLDKHFIQTTSLFLSNAPYDTGLGWDPIGDDVEVFSGSYDGDGFPIVNLFINRINEDNVGLFGAIEGATLANVWVVNADVTGNAWVGAIAGAVLENSLVEYSAVTNGTVYGDGLYVGGMIGRLYSNTNLDSSFSAVTVTGDMSHIGGLVGNSIINSTITNSNSTGNVISNNGSAIGGLVGYASGTISESYATGSVTSTNGQNIGGLVGRTASSTSITKSYATGAVTGYRGVGGLIGYHFQGMVETSYSSGSVTASSGSLEGGLIGWGSGTVTNSYWNTETSGVNSSYGGSGLTSAEMRDTSSFTNWDFTNIWTVLDGFTISFPYLKANQTNIFPGEHPAPTIEGSGTDDDPFQISTFSQLDSIRYYLDAHFIQTADIDLDVSPYNSGEGWEPIGDNLDAFTGSYNGAGYSIQNLFIDNSTDEYLGLFGYARNAELTNIHLQDIDITGYNYYVGGIAGYLRSTTLNTCSVSGNIVTEANYAGGVAGYAHYSSSITSCSTSGSITGDDETASYLGGLVGILNSSEIDSSYSTMNIDGDDQLGGMLGGLWGTGELSNSYSTGEITGGLVLGGGVGDVSSNATIETSFSTGDVEGTSGGGFVGNNSGTIRNSYSIGDIDISSATSGGGFVDINQGTIENSYSIGDVTNSQGGFVRTNGSGGIIINSYWDEGANNRDSGIYQDLNSIPQTAAGLTNEEMMNPENFSNWDFDSVWGIGKDGALAFRPQLQALFSAEDIATDYFSGGSGTTASPFEISTPGDLDNIRSGLLYHYRQTSDLDLDVSPYNTGTGWDPIGTIGSEFSGTYDGDGHIIYNLYIDDSGADNKGLFGNVDYGSSFSNLGLENISIDARNYVGALAGTADSTSVSQVYVRGTMRGRSDIGGIVGRFRNNSVISNCYSDVDIATNTSTLDHGGIVGEATDATISNCYALGSLTNSSSAGGIVGAATNSTISNSYWNTETTGLSSSTEGIGVTTKEMIDYTTFSGWDFELIWGVGDNGYVVAAPYLRSFKNLSDFPKVFATGSGSESNPFHVSTAAELDSVRNYLQFYYSQTANIDLNIDPYNNGDGWVPIGTDTDPFTGEYDGKGHTISNLYINSINLDEGGLFGYLADSAGISNVGLLDVSILADNNVGALVGRSDGGIISRVYSSGSIEGDNRVGGLIGYYIDSNISNCYSTASVTSDGNRMGGLIGHGNGATVTNCYSSGSVSDDNNSGGLVGDFDNGTLTNSFWNTQTSGLAGSAAGSGKTTAEMSEQATYSGWDFAETWAIDEGNSYPFFQDYEAANSLSISGDEGWRMITSPVSGTTFGELLEPLWTQGFTGADTENGDSNVYQWDENAQSFVAISNADNIVPNGGGFITYVFADDDFDGTPDAFPKTLSVSGDQRTGNLTPTLSFTNTENLSSDGWNLMGNPYGSTIDWDAPKGWKKSNLDQTFYVWSDSANGGTGAYLSWNGSTGTLGNGLISPWQGFWVKANGESPVITFTDSVRHAGGSFLKKAPTPQIKLKLENQGSHSNAVVMFSENAALEKDEFDAYKLSPLSGEYLSLSTQHSNLEPMDIQALPLDVSQTELDIILDGNSLSGSTKLSWSLEGLDEKWEILLMDIETGVETSLLAQSSYLFDVGLAKQRTSESESKAAAAFTLPVLPLQLIQKAKAPQFSRLKLRLINSSVVNEPFKDVPSVVELQQNYPNPFNPGTTIEYGVPETSKVTLEVFDMLGRKVSTLVNGETKQGGRYSLQFDASRLASGMYIYRLATGNTIMTRKFTLIK